jgi:hypothetical protein
MGLAAPGGGCQIVAFGAEGSTDIRSYIRPTELHVWRGCCNDSPASYKRESGAETQLGVRPASRNKGRPGPVSTMPGGAYGIFAS